MTQESTKQKSIKTELFEMEYLEKMKILKKNFDPVELHLRQLLNSTVYPINKDDISCINELIERYQPLVDGYKSIFSRIMEEFNEKCTSDLTQVDIDYFEMIYTKIDNSSKELWNKVICSTYYLRSRIRNRIDLKKSIEVEADVTENKKESQFNRFKKFINKVLPFHLF